MKLDSTSQFQMKNEKVMEASYKIVLFIVKDNKLHTFGESFVKPCLLTACKIVTNEESCAEVAKIPLLNNTIKNNR